MPMHDSKTGHVLHDIRNSMMVEAIADVLL